MIENSVLEKLEFTKVLNSISNYAITDNGKKILLNLKPLTELNKISREGQCVTEAKEILIRDSTPQIDYIPDYLKF